MLYKRGGKFWAQFVADGIRHQLPTGSSDRRQAERIERKLREEANLRRFDIITADPSLSVGEVVAKYLSANEPNKFYEGRLKQLLPFFADVPVLRLTRNSASEYRQFRKKQAEVKDATVNRDLACLRHILYWAVEERVLVANPFNRLKLPMEARTIILVLSVVEEDVLLKHAPEHLRRMVLTSLYTGMRRSEIFKQRWEHIDLGRRLLYVSSSKTMGGELREIPLATPIFEMLSVMRRDGEHVFTYRGLPIGTYKTAWNHLVKTVLNRHFLFKALRSTFNTRLMEAGVVADVRRALMGHSAGKDVNLRHYTAVELPARRRAIQMLESWIAEQRSALEPQKESAEPSASPETEVSLINLKERSAYKM
jgi:integrase